MIGGIIWTLLALGILLGVAYKFYFLRDPAIRTPDEDVIVSPAWGTISKIVEFGADDGEITITKGAMGKVHAQSANVSEKGWLINIVMTPMDVHYQYCPMPGKVLGVKHIPGTFLNAVKDAKTLRAALENESAHTLIAHKDDPSFRCKVVQIAGFVARRIVPFLKENQQVDRGQKLGVIKLGSQVSLLIPKLQLDVQEGDRMIGGQTIIARRTQ